MVFKFAYGMGWRVGVPKTYLFVALVQAGLRSIDNYTITDTYLFPQQKLKGIGLLRNLIMKIAAALKLR